MPTQLAQPSPKRKRDQPPPVPLLNTALAIRPARTPPPNTNSPPPAGDADSPRTAVADQLRDMQLAWSATIPMSPLTPTDNGVHKKPKLDALRVDSGTSLNTALSKERPRLPQDHNNTTLGTIALLPKFAAATEIPETPQASQPRMLPDIASFAQPTPFVSAPAGSTAHHSDATRQKPQKQTSSQAHARLRKPLSPPPSVLTWQDSEITGHLADPSTDPDDDGTGLNGIGFKPTPALAYARSQKRRQQLNEWKLRETREARAKRSERRRRGVRDTPSRDTSVQRDMAPKHVDTSKRSVKFAV
ncbi:hypothetical protein NX059_003131 [Plenodomus lindquistii]|nr:hypothetical protein NX059_003131 [Plenodomus lindquistii]